MKYYIEMRTQFGEWERVKEKGPIEHGTNEFTNKAKALKAKNDLRRWAQAVNVLRRSEGSREMVTENYRVADENGNTIY